MQYLVHSSQNRNLKQVSIFWLVESEAQGAHPLALIHQPGSSDTQAYTQAFPQHHVASLLSPEGLKEWGKVPNTRIVCVCKEEGIVMS